MLWQAKTLNRLLPETQEPVLLVSAQSLDRPVVASHPNIRVDSIKGAMRLNADDVAPLRHKNMVIESEAFMRDDGPTEQIQEVD